MPVGGIEALARVLRELLAEPERLRRMGQHALRKVQDYGIEQARDGLLEAVRKVCA